MDAVVVVMWTSVLTAPSRWDVVVVMWTSVSTPPSWTVPQVHQACGCCCGCHVDLSIDTTKLGGCCCGCHVDLSVDITKLDSTQVGLCVDVVVVVVIVFSGHVDPQHQYPARCGC